MEKSYRAYSILDVEKMADEDEEYFYIEGIASTPSPDRDRDIVDPMGAKFETPMKMLWQHQHREPVGEVTFAKPTKKGIPFQARLPKVKEAGRLKDRIDEAIQSVKYKLVTAVSIGFRPINDAYEYMENGGIHFKEWEWFELSLVTIPANSEAVISAVKSVDKEFLPASGHEGASNTGQSPGIAGKARPIQLIPRKNQ